MSIIHFEFSTGRLRSITLATTSLLAAWPLQAIAQQSFYEQRNLVSDGFIAADHVDPNLVNPWGIAPNPTGVWWVADNATGVSSLYDGEGIINDLVVDIPGIGGAPASPTGIVFSGGSDFVVTDGMASAPARFIFASQDGTISGWAPAVPPPAPSTEAQPAVDKSEDEAIYMGLALLSTPAGNRLYATDFHNGRVDVFDGEFNPVAASGNFEDNQIPDDFAPFGIAAIDGKIFVTFAKQDEDAEDEVTGKHLGYVDVFDGDGHLLKRLVKKGKLNAPWGLVKAPSDFGHFSNCLLVGNFGDGRINAYNINTGHFRGTLRSGPGEPIEIEGLWGLGFGNDGLAGPSTTLFFAAGPEDEEHGLFGSITLIDED